MRLKGLICLLIICAFFDCKDARKSNENSYYTIIDDKDGPTIKENEFAAITYTQKTDDGIMVHDKARYDSRPTYLFRQPSFFKGDMFEALGNLSEGDSAVFKIRIDSMINKAGLSPARYAKSKYMIYNVRVDKVIPRHGMSGVEYDKIINEYKQQIEQAVKKSEPAKIQAYINANHLKPQVTTSGINYIIQQAGSGHKPLEHNTVLVNYTGKTLDGKVFETTSASIAKNAGVYDNQMVYKPIKIPVTKSGKLTGFDEALTMFPKGSRVTLILPSKLAYGAQQYKSILPYTPLICELEIVDIF